MPMGEYKKYKVYIDGADITSSVTTSTIFQDIQSPTWSACIYCMDSADLLNSLPIRSGSKVRIVIETRHEVQTDGYVEYNFVVFRVGEKTQQNAKTQFYVIHCVPKLFLVNQTIRVNNTFKSNTITDVMSTIWGEYVKGGEQLNVIGCENVSHIVCQNQTLFLTYGWLLKQAYRKKTADFLFYQADHNRWQIKPISEMYDRSHTNVTIFQKPASLRQNGEYLFQNQTYNVLNMESQNYDSAMNLANGYYKNKLQSYDFFKKTSSENTFTFGDDTPEDAVNKNWTDSVFEAENANVTFVSKVSNLTDGNNSCNEAEAWLQSRKQSLLKLEQEKYIVQLAGSAKMYEWLAKTVNFDMPNQSDLNDENFDRKRKGKYLVTAIAHYLNPNGYVVNLELVKRRLEE